ncbi:sugar phosphate nucleotidyltransferase [Clostridium estertheticum]|uniref:sugar phosphate nucleotidyltransferase n=1 Tax=Clostridium estertheticum TaxID=238834 RepID=UPI001C7DF83F|nr:sugar phosphate nucleotidyltransferase [Clostridium estertheticum]MBX4266842.1 NTP transferase domain-containing protein [Clostridium estertheticum]WLC89026.1 NTP transferase domain-containing protein [Clostridium estertheticum]
MRGVILAGGHGKRLNPLTLVTNKHLLPVYKKPMIYYPIETFAKIGIKEILIVTNGEYIGHFYKLLRTGEDFGVKLHYEIQEGNEGTGAALLCAEEFAKGDDFMVILGDNIVTENIKDFVDDFEEEKKEFKAKILITKSENPELYGVVEFKDNKITRLVEKPKEPFSNYVNTGLWIFKSEAFEMLNNMKKSSRNEYETTDVLNNYAQQGQLTYGILKSKWTDAGTFEQLYKATALMKELEDNAKEACTFEKDIIY